MSVHVRPPAQAASALAERRQYPTPSAWLRALSDGELKGAWATEQAAVPEANGRPPADESFRVVLPITGGLDSTTAWAMAKQAGLPLFTVYCDFGQEYRDAELAAIKAVTGEWPDVVVNDMPIPERWGHLIPGRNAAIIWSAAAIAYARAWWGEVWLGNLAGETPARGGDKSSRFLATAQQLLTLMGYDVRLCSPLALMDKPDLVRWWLRQPNGLDVLHQVKSCFHPHVARCGQCQTCFRLMVALEINGLDTRSRWWEAEDWTQHVDKYEPLMREATATGDWSAYSPVRCRTTLKVIDRLRRQGRV